MRISLGDMRVLFLSGCVETGLVIVYPPIGTLPLDLFSCSCLLCIHKTLKAKFQASFIICNKLHAVSLGYNDVNKILRSFIGSPLINHSCKVLF